MMITESEDIKNKLFHKTCPFCGLMAHMKLTGLVYYTAPAVYEWKCQYCNKSGDVKYDSIKIIYIPDENMEAYKKEADGTQDAMKLHELSKKYGKYKERDITIWAHA